MADYFSPTVVQPTIPNADMTALERLVLGCIFDSEVDGDGLYFFAEITPSDSFEMAAERLRAAYAASADMPSELRDHLADRVDQIGDADTDIEIDLSGISWEFIFQDIVKRSPTLDHVSVITSFTCSTMRPDGFGGMAVLITADTIQGKSTEDILCGLLDEAEHGPIGTAPGFGEYVLLRLSEKGVRAAIPAILETDETLTPIAADAISDADIRAACLAVVAEIDLSEEGGAAEFRAALVAIRAAERRQEGAK
jgi:hypothetical protein